jgi:PAS domain S-box-containing protein
MTGRRVQNVILAMAKLMLLVLGFCCLGDAHADAALDDWRNQVASVRALAENDVPRSYKQAQLLQNAIPANATPADRARLLNLLARIEVHTALTAKAIEHARAALKLATENNDRIGQAEAHLNLYRSSINEGNMETLVASAMQSLSVLEGVDRPDLLGEAMVDMAMMYMRNGQFEESVTMAMQGMEIASHSKNSFAMAYAAQGLATFLSLNGRPKEAHEHYLHMLESARAAHSKVLEAVALTGMGSTLDALGDPDKAEKYINESLRLYQVIGAPFGISIATQILAGHFIGLNRIDRALPLYNEAIGIWMKYDNPIGLWYPLRSRSQIYQRLGNHAAALADAEWGERLARRINLPLYLGGSAQQLAEVHAAKGNYQQAYKYMQEAAAMAADAQRKKSSTRLVELMKRYENESRQREINELTRRNQLQTAELRQRELQQRLLWTVLVGSITVLAVTTFFLIRLRHSHATIRSLNVGLEQIVQARTAELRQQTRYLRTLIDTLPLRVWLKDTTSRYLALNQAAADTCGLSADELVGKTDQEVLPGEYANAVRSDDVEVMQARHRKTLEERHIVADKPVWIETFKAPVLDEDGTVLGTVGFVRDISARKEAEASREAALAEAQRLARVRSEFLAQMSHELRTPLNGILGYAQILLRDKTLREDEIAGLNVIQQSGEHLLTLINDILDFAKIEAGKLELYETDIPFIKFLRIIAEMVEVRADQKDLDFQCDMAPDLPIWVQVDEKRLRQVLLNLLSNAVKFTDHGVVRLSVGRTMAGRIRFEVRDTGIGIGTEQLARLFRPFEQAGDVERRVGGTGLGLAISQQFVQLMGGHIHVESRLGEGSTFWFELDMPEIASSPKIVVRPDVAGYEGPRRKILVVDDVAENRAVAIDMLRPLGFEMSEAVDGNDGLEKAVSLRPDLILMDLIMPGMNGLELTRRLRALPIANDVPIIAISASASSADQQHSLAAGANTFLSKPVNYDSLLEQIAEMLSLNWVYGAPRAPATSENKEAEQNVELPEDQIDALYQLARLGNMQDILQWATRLEALDERYHPFANHLRMLANGYQSKALLSLVKRHMESKSIESKTLT